MADEASVAFGRRVHALARNRGWSARELARRAGVSASTMTRLADGQTVTIDTAVKIAAALGVTLDSLVTVVACRQCADLPPAGFTCRACGADGLEAVA